MIFQVIMYRCESWAINKTECQRVDAFKLCCWRKLFRVPWFVRRSNQSILKEINPEYSLEGQMLKLKLQNFGHMIRRAHSLEKTMILGKIEGERRWVWQRMRWLDSTTNLMDINVNKLCETVKDIGDCLAAVHGFAKSWTWLSNWTNSTDIRSENFKIIFFF